MKKALITHIQRNSIHDGPGIRTTVFFKGCNLCCLWCHNPESINTYPELMFVKDKCINCGYCKEFLESNKIDLYKEYSNLNELPSVEGLENVSNFCFSKALSLSAKCLSVDDVMNKILPDRPFYKKSNGGITLSGGEPLIQHKFVNELLSACVEKGIHTAIETNLSLNWNLYKAIIPKTKLFMVDIKVWDKQKHIEYTGRSNDMIFKNLEKLDEHAVPIIVRTPLISGVNDNEDEIKNISIFLNDLKNLVSYELLPYHPYGVPKLKSLRLKQNNFFEYISNSKLRDLNDVIDRNLTRLNRK